MVIKNVMLADGGTVWAAVRLRSSRYRFSRSRRASTTTPATPTTTCSSLAMPRFAPSACSRTSRSIDAPFNLQYYKPGDYHTEAAYMGCRTRVIGNVYDPDPRDSHRQHAATSASPSINLPAPCHRGSRRHRQASTASLDEMMDLVVDQLLARFRDPVQQACTQLPVPDGSGRLDRFREARPRTTALPRYSSTAPSPWDSSDLQSA